MVKAKHDVDALKKCPTGIKGLDEITKGGLPRGRPTLICGGAGFGTVGHWRFAWSEEFGQQPLLFPERHEDLWGDRRGMFCHKWSAGPCRQV